MIIAGLKANLRAFSPWLIYNSTCGMSSTERDFRTLLSDISYSGSLPSYMMLNSPYTCPQFRIGMVHFFVASKVAK